MESYRESDTKRNRWAKCASYRWVILAVWVGLLGSVWIVPAAVHGAVGELIVLKGHATVFRNGRTHKISQRFELESEDFIRTGTRSKIHVKFYPPLRGSDLIAGNETEFIVRDPATRRKTPFLKLIWGAIRSRLSVFSRQRPYIRTGTAVIGVKGTDFIVYVKKKNASEFIGVEGLIEAVSRSRPADSIRIGKRQWGEIVEGEKPKPPIRVPDELWFPALKEFSFPGETPPSPSSANE